MSLVTPSLEFDSLLFPDKTLIAGFDEVGRGSLAGPLVVAAVILPADFIVPIPFGDSKALKEPYRSKVAKYIKQNALEYSIVRVENVLIDTIGVTKCLEYAFDKAIKRLKTPLDGIILDGRSLKNDIITKQIAVIKGDTLSASVAAASIIAKVYRDKIMVSLASNYPNYGFELHKGYGTKLHRQKIVDYGPCALHRLSFIRKYYVFS